MNKKQIIIILCAALVLCLGVAGYQVHSAKSEKPTETNSISSISASSEAQASETSTGAENESSSAAESNAEGSTAKGESTSEARKPDNQTTAGQTTAANQTTTKPATTATTTTTTTQKQTEPEPQQIKITLSITCHNAVGKTDKAPQSGVILGSKSYTANEGATVFDALKALCSQNGISLAYDKPYYIQGIGGLYEKDCGGGSGWMYRVNGTTPMTACNKYTLKDGDVVEWYYVTNINDK